MILLLISLYQTLQSGARNTSEVAAPKFPEKFLEN